MSASFIVSLFLLYLLLPSWNFCNANTVSALPGIVDSGITRKAEGAALKVVIAAFSVFNSFLQTPPDECGEFHLMAATSAMYPPNAASATVSGVPLVAKLEIARGVNGKTGSGVYSINEKGESALTKAEKVLEKYRQDGTAKKIVNHVEEVAKRLTGTAVVSL
jgi:hypothetical protein